MKVKYKDKTKKEIFVPLKNRYLQATPEEIVRQKFIVKLINDYGYSLNQMEQEVKLTNSQRGTGRASADLIVWKSETEKKENKTAFLVMEFKAGNLKLKVEDCYQGYNYATWSRAKIFAITNGEVLEVYKTIEDELPLKLQRVNDIPNFSEISDKKLDKFLTKTKEFTGKEFADLLHKCHNIIRNNDKLDPADAFDEISKVLFIKIMYERSADKGAIFSKDEFERLKKNFDELNEDDNKLSFIQDRFEKVKKRYKTDGIFEDNEKIKIREKSFELIVKELEIYNLTDTSSDVKGIAFERFLGTTFRGNLGQFFTPRVIVDFIINILEPKESELICDPCAGSGGFLIKSFETVKNRIDTKYVQLKKDKQKNIFGDNLESIGNAQLKKEYENFVLEINKKQEKEIEILSKSSIFGTDANPRMARVSKMNMIMHGDGHNGIHHNDGLLNVNGIFRDRFDLIVTNPPFGSTLDKKSPTVEEDDKYKNEEMIAKYTDEYGERYSEEMRQVTDNFGESIRMLFDVGETSGQTEVLFIERSLDLLKAGGRMGIVLPEGVLNSSNLEEARNIFEGKAKILLIVSLPQEIFISSGASVKTSLVFLKKFTDNEKSEFDNISAEVKAKIEIKYFDELENIDKKLKLRGEEALSKDEKSKLRESRKLILEKQKKEIRENIKIRFDYEIPISNIEQAGISTTGEKIENQLPELVNIFREYRRVNNLWSN